MQGRLFPLEFTRIDPAGLGTAECKLIGEGEDGIPYLIKRVEDGRYVPATEWICSSLAMACGVPVPPFEIAIMPNGERVFASRWEGGTEEDLSARKMLFEGGNIPPGIFSSILALDYFLLNVDRHPGNFLIRTDTRDASAKRLIAMDFGHSFIATAWPIKTGKMPECNTLKVCKVLANIHGVEVSSFERVINSLHRLPNDTMQKLCNDLPNEWLREDVAAELCKWWIFLRPARLKVIMRNLVHVYRPDTICSYTSGS